MHPRALFFPLTFPFTLCRVQDSHGEAHILSVSFMLGLAEIHMVSSLLQTYLGGAKFATESQRHGDSLKARAKLSVNLRKYEPRYAHRCCHGFIGKDSL